MSTSLRIVNIGFPAAVCFALCFLLFSLVSCEQDSGVSNEKPSVLGKQYLLISKIYFNGNVPQRLTLIPEKVDSIEIFFNLPLDKTTLSLSTLSFEPALSSSPSLPLTMRVKGGDSVVVLTMTHNILLTLGDSYLIKADQSLQSTVAGTSFDGVTLQYTTPLLTDASLQVFQNTTNDTIRQTTGAYLFQRLYENRISLSSVKLLLKPGRKASLYMDGNPLPLNSLGIYEGDFDFTTKSQYVFTVKSQAGNTQDYTIRLVNKPPMVVTSSFLDNDALPDKYAVRLDVTKPAAVSPPLSWSNIPAEANAFIIIEWNKDVSNPYDWFVGNIPGSVTSIGEGGYIENSNVLVPYEGFIFPPRGTEYIIQYAVFALKREDPSVPIDFGDPTIDPSAIFPKLIEYATDAVAKGKSYSTVKVHDEIPIIGVAVIKGRAQTQ